MARHLSALTAALLLATSAPAAGPPEPTITVQAKPGGQLIDEVKTFIRGVSGDEAVKDFERWMKETLGEKGFTGVDMLRPPVAYVHLAPKLEESWGVVVIPVTNGKDLLDLFGRLNFELVEQKGQKGLFEFVKLGAGLGDPGTGGVPVRMRLGERSAHISINGKPEVLDVASLLDTARLTDPAEPAPLAAHLHLTRLDPALKKRALAVIEEGIKEIEGGPQIVAPVWSAVVMLPALKLVHRTAEQVAGDGERLTLRIQTRGPRGKELSYEFAVTPKPGTKLAGDIAAWKPVPNRFAGILPETAVAGGVARLPLFAPELRESAGKLVSLLTREAAAEEAAKILAEFEKGALRTIKGSEVDLGAAITGPNEAGLYTAVGAISFDDPSGMEKALRESVKSLPEAVRGAVKFDAARAGGLAVHTVAAGPFLPDEVKRVFGDGATVAVAFGPTAVYAAIGPDAVKELGRVVALKPGAARLLDVRMNPKKMKTLAGVSGSPAAAGFAEALSDEDRLVSVHFIDVAGGPDLVVRWGSDLFRIPGATFGR